ncbi:hypothetical protein [Klenkia sesuvii]
MAAKLLGMSLTGLAAAAMTFSLDAETAWKIAEEAAERFPDDERAAFVEVARLAGERSYPLLPGRLTGI